MAPYVIARTPLMAEIHRPGAPRFFFRSSDRRGLIL
jgi:hypothetical protein